MNQLIYDTFISAEKMNIVCFVSGTGTNYREIAKNNPGNNYFVFTNRPGCGGTEIAKSLRHPIIALSHIPYLKEARKKYGAGNVPRNCPERVKYEQDACTLIEEKIGKQPDLVCLAGFDQWNTDWLINRYFPRMLNVHPGDTTRNHTGLHWIPAAKAIIAGDKTVCSTLFIVDKSDDKGPILLQSHALNIEETLAKQGESLSADYKKVTGFVKKNTVSDYAEFQKTAPKELQSAMTRICETLQQALKERGDWVIYSRGVEMIAQGRVAIDGKKLYVDDIRLPVYGYKPQ